MNVASFRTLLTGTDEAWLLGFVVAVDAEHVAVAAAIVNDDGEIQLFDGVMPMSGIETHAAEDAGMTALARASRAALSAGTFVSTGKLPETFALMLKARHTLSLSQWGECPCLLPPVPLAEIRMDEQREPGEVPPESHAEAVWLVMGPEGTRTPGNLYPTNIEARRARARCDPFTHKHAETRAYTDPIAALAAAWDDGVGQNGRIH